MREDSIKTGRVTKAATVVAALFLSFLAASLIPDDTHADLPTRAYAQTPVSSVSPLQPATGSMITISLEEEADLLLVDTDIWPVEFAAMNCEDFNGDGIADMLVTSLGGMTPWHNRVDIVLGSRDLGGVLDISTDSAVRIEGQFRIPGTNPPQYLTPRARAVGDFNGDSLTDVALDCCHGAFAVTTDSYAYIVYGGPAQLPLVLDLPTDADVTIADLSKINHIHLFGAGDINGDGCEDLGVSTEYWDRYCMTAVYLCTSMLPEVIDVNEAQAQVEKSFGEGHTKSYFISDINGDGCDELVFTSDLSQIHDAYIWLGKPGLLVPATASATSAEIVVLPSMFGDPDVRASGDVNGDGIGDVTGTLGADTADGLLFKAHVWFGTPGYDSRVLESANADATFLLDGMQYPVTKVLGDADGDGTKDVFIEVRYPSFFHQPDELYIFRGGPSLRGTHHLSEAVARIVGDRDIFCETAGDFNGDGYDDFVFRGRHPDSAYMVMFGPLLRPDYL